MAAEKKSMKGYYTITFLIGLGFFTMGLMDPLYDTYIPIFLNNYISSDGIIGLIMGIDNFFAILLIPVFSALSDKTVTPIGRRMPYIIITLPLTAVFFGLLPISALHSLILLIVIIFFLNLFKQAARGPVVALMPDIIPGEYRSEANGVINTMGGIAAIVGTVGLARLYDINISFPLIGQTLVPFGKPETPGTPIGILPFLCAGILVIIAVLLLFSFVKEKPSQILTEEDKRVPIRTSLRLIFQGKEKSAIFILFALLSWFLAYQGVLPWIGLYGVMYLNLTPGIAAMSAGMVAIAYALFAIPSGIIAHKVGRKRVIRTCLAALVIISTALFLHYPVSNILGFSHTLTFITFWAILFLFGMFWGSVITNSFPMLWQMATFKNIGIYTGLYYFFSQMAGIISPGFTGLLRDFFGSRIVFLYAGVFMLIAFMLMGFVKKGEASDPAVELQDKQN